MDLSRELALSLSLCQRAAEVIMAVYRTDFAVDWKSPRDPVTAADRDANALIVGALAEAFPDDAICAEEASEESAAEASARGGRCWFVDPLDGTREFVDRNGEFCVMIGLAIDGVARLGAVYAPVWGRTWYGIPGLGAWERGDDGATRPLRVAPAGAVSMVVSRSHPHPEVIRLAETLGATHVVPCGGVGLKVAKVVSGEVALYAQLAAGPKLWDGCAPEAIARGAGAAMTDAQGRAIRYDTPALALDAGIVVAHRRALVVYDRGDHGRERAALPRVRRGDPGRGAGARPAAVGAGRRGAARGAAAVPALRPRGQHGRAVALGDRRGRGLSRCGPHDRRSARCPRTRR